VVQRRKSRGRSGTRGHNAREARVSHRETARFSPPLEGMRQPQGDDLPGPAVRLRGLGEACQLVSNLTEEGRETLDGGGHSLLRTWQGCTLSTSLEAVHDYGNRVIMSSYPLLVCKLTPLVTMVPGQLGHGG
jgi:hypothetical protein